MNKTVTINISGIIFHIEEDAYDKLSKYLATIKGYFSKTDGGSEIMSDIEARVAEMLQSKTSAIKQVVLMADVDSVIETMGKPEEFAGEGEHNQSSTPNNDYNSGAYSTGEPVKKRLFRDPDHKAVGGVCSGIAAYFDVDMIWIRLAMFLLIFFGGLSLWVYIILWIVIPEARTTAEKLAMHGEKIDINNISKSVKEEAEQFKNRASKFGNDVRNSHYSSNPNFFDKLGNFIKDLIIGITKFFARVVGLILLIFGVCFMLGLLSSVLGFSIVGANTEFNDWVNLFFMERSHYTLGAFGLILFFGVPFLMMIYGGIKLLFKIHYSNRWLNISAGCIWLVGFMIALYVGITTGKDFSEGGRVKEQVQLTTNSDTLYLTLNKSKELMKELKLNDVEDEDYDEKESHVKIHSHHSDYVVSKKGDTKFIVGYASMNILPSTGENFELYIIKKSRGEDKRSAAERARNIDYKITQSDSLISFDEIFVVNQKEKFRVQDVQVMLKVPRGKVVKLDKSLENFIYDVENVTNTYDGDMVGRRWIMTKDGLECIDCDGLEMEDSKYGRGVSMKELKSAHGLPQPPEAPNGPGSPINVDVKNAKINIDKDGIKINSKDANVNVDKNGIHIDTKSDKGDKGNKGDKGEK